ncbi:MAG: hypothetical protein WCX32_00615 [Clostridia bacterium]|jgi:hypothetical protein|nr:hypothetical protein [Clostridia bacterium]
MISKLLYDNVASLNDKLICTLIILATVIFVIGSIFYIIKMAKVQKKLRTSSVLIKLSNSKIGYITLSVIAVLASIFFIWKVLNVNEIILTTLYISGSIMCVSVCAMFIIRITANAGVTQNGIYLFSKFIQWENLHDFYINEKKCKVVLSTNWKGPLSLIGTTFPLEFDKDKLELLKKILTENRNKFFANLEIR